MMMEKALSPRLLKNADKHAYRAELLKCGMESLWYVIERDTV